MIENLLENANWAPTHSMNEPWRFKIFAGEARQKLGEFQSNWYKENIIGDNFNPAKHQQLLTRPSQASHIIAPKKERMKK
ncbi:MAG: nitroreductase family protein [Chitinophagales bacterium]